MQSKQMNVNDEDATDGVLDMLPQADSTAPTEAPAPVSEKPDDLSMTREERPIAVNPEKIAKKIEEDKAFAERLAQRQPLSAAGNPNARISDPLMANVEPRYIVVQNQSDKFLIIPDMKNSDEDLGLTFQPGETVLLTDFYSPQQINRSKGLRYAATVLKGVGDNPMLVPLATEEEGSLFKVPEKKRFPKGTMYEDPNDNDFDERFAEMEQREAKREEKLLKKTLASRKLREHGKAPAHV